MKGQCRVLQNGVQAVAFDGGGIEPRKGVGGEHNKQQEGKADGALHGKHAGFQGGRQVFAKQRHGSAKHRQNENPQNHGALMVSPHAGDFIKQRLG